MSNKARSPIKARAKKVAKDKIVINNFIHHLKSLPLKNRFVLAFDILFRRK